MKEGSKKKHSQYFLTYMTKKLLAIVMVLAALGDVLAGNNPVKRARLDVRQQKFSRAEQQLRQARAERSSTKRQRPR